MVTAQPNRAEDTAVSYQKHFPHLFLLFLEIKSHHGEIYPTLDNPNLVGASCLRHCTGYDGGPKP